MDRRTTLTKLFGQADSDKASFSSATAPTTTVLSGLNPYTGTFDYEHAAHLLRRSMFGPTYQQIKDAANNGLEATIQQLFADQPLPAEPVNHNFEEDPEVQIGESWVNKPYQPGDLGQSIRAYRRQSLNAWTIEVWRKAGVSIHEKITLFWHNHYVTSDIPDANFVYKYITTLRKNALGNYRELTKLIAIDPSMLLYLNGNENTAASPNENFARELLELFTIGKGPAVGLGDYTNYTEDDVVEIAKVLTGWRQIGLFTQENVDAGSIFLSGRHNQTQKQLSHRFDDLLIDNMDDQEYAHLIDIIYSKDECAKFICRKLYRWFVYYIISAEVETDVIEPMAQIILDNDYEIKPALEALLQSEHFFDMLSIGPMIKNPIDFVMTVLNTFEVEIDESDLDRYYRVMFQLIRVPLPRMQMVPYNPPSVAGWKAYYQEPTFYRIWISSSTLPVRMDFTNLMAFEGFAIGDTRAQINVLKFAASVDDPFDPNNMIDEFSKILYPQPITLEQKDLLKSILLPGLPDFEWTVEYGEYINDPTNSNLEAAIVSKLQDLLAAMMSMPEFYLS